MKFYFAGKGHDMTYTKFVEKRLHLLRFLISFLRPYPERIKWIIDTKK